MKLKLSLSEGGVEARGEAVFSHVIKVVGEGAVKPDK